MDVISLALKIKDGTGKHAFIGLGFTKRNEEFDFNVALSDHEKYVKTEIEKDVDEANDESRINIHPDVNHRLKIKPLSLAPPPEKVKSKPLGLAPPPVASGKIRSPIPPPPNNPTAVQMTSTTHNIAARNSIDVFPDFSQLKLLIIWADE
uniref:NECAP PHear domain-containing protein n=1 Tax=Lactuca sativa TaxID=4236 RepID=A0A9R1V7L5_LACSA|nr:hypothetical protein LSAT_V11C600312670 [Lactuca sativa]